MWPALDTVFHVTKSGYSSSLRAGDACWERRAKGKNEEFEDDFEFEESRSPALDDEVDREEGVEAVEALAGDADA